MKRLHDLGEDALVARLLRGFPDGGLAVGPGDDCAAVDPGRGPLRLLKTDAIVERVHFRSETPAARVGWKAVARVLSDFAAMGGRPDYLLVTVAMPGETPVAWAEGLYRGIRRCLDRHGGALAGGETVGLPEGAPIMVSVAGEGRVGRRGCVRRGGGRPGDVLAVTGRLGGSAGGRHLRFAPRLAEGERLAAAGARAMMDLSDGLAKDLPRLAKACGAGFELDRGAVPRHRGCDLGHALGDGEDYELLAAVPPDRWQALADAWPPDLAPLTAIGHLTESGGELSGGWDHYAR
jgi:thiamine-monophosphate kinase